MAGATDEGAPATHLFSGRCFQWLDPKAGSKRKLLRSRQGLNAARHDLIRRPAGEVGDMNTFLGGG